MTLLVLAAAVVGWFGSGEIATRIMIRHYQRLLPGAPSSDLAFSAALSTAMGPIAIFAAILYVAMFPLTSE